MRRWCLMSREIRFTEQPSSSRQKTAAPKALAEMAASAGVFFNGKNPWDIQVHDPQLYQRILSDGSLGFGEAYMDGMWSCNALDTLFQRLLSMDVDDKIKRMTRLRLVGAVLRNRLFNLQSENRAYQVGEQHYDIGNDVFEAMLDNTMSYSCGFWQHADNLQQAQYDKLEMICRKLQLQPGEHLLEIGCGWGGLAHYAATRYGVRVTGITVSKEQQKMARERCAGLPIDIQLTDYRKVEGRFDKVASVGMFEHVGSKNYSAYFDTVIRVMKDNGLFLLHTIGNYITLPTVDTWIDKYIFPNGKLPSAKEITENLENRFIIEDWHNFGQDYDKTLMAWWKNFDQSWPALEARYGQRFYRMWQYYLMSCAGYFRSRQGQLWQLVLSKRTRQETYRSIRLIKGSPGS